MNNKTTVNVTVKEMPDGGLNVYNNGELIADGYDSEEWSEAGLIEMWTERLVEEQSEDE